MAKNLTSGIQTLPELFRTIIGALASDTAVIVSADYSTGLTRDFLLKKIRTYVYLEDFTEAKAHIIGFARGDMTIAEIGTALATQLKDPEDFQLWDSFANAKGIFWETLRLIGGIQAGNVATHTPIWNETISIGGGKGIPLEAAHGIQIFLFNPDGSAVGEAGTTCVGGVQLVGVFMEGSN